MPKVKKGRGGKPVVWHQNPYHNSNYTAELLRQENRLDRQLDELLYRRSGERDNAEIRKLSKLIDDLDERIEAIREVRRTIESSLLHHGGALSKEELMKKYPNLGLKKTGKLDANSQGDDTDTSLVTSVKNFFAPIRKRAPPKVRQFVARNGKDKIITLEVGRTPIAKPVTGFLNTISLGKYSKKKKELGYDNVYHTFLVATLESGKKVKIEKNSQVEITDYKPGTGELRHIPLKEPVPVSKFLEKGEEYFKLSDADVSRGQNFWKYDKRTNNCQYFVDDLIRGNATEIAEAPEVSEPFRKQDAEELSKSLPDVSDSILNFKQRLDHAVSGDGLRRYRPHITYFSR